MRTQGVIGAVIMAAGGICPLVHVPIIGNWNYFGIDTSLGTIYYVIVALALTGALLNKTSLMQACGWTALLWVVLTLGAVWFKSHDYFHFIHFRNLINLAAEMVKYKWGWFVIITGALALVAVRKPADKPALEF